MNAWHYSAGGKQHGPVAEDMVVQALASGQLPPDTLLWRDGMAQWQEARSIQQLWANGEAAAAPAPAYPAPAGYAGPAAQRPLAYEPSGGQAQELVISPRVLDLLRQTKPWVRLFSVLMFIGIGFMTLGVVSWGIIMMGVASSSSSRNGGEFAALGVVGMLIFGGVILLYLFPAIYLGRYASRIAALLQFGRQQDLESALEAQKSFWKFLGVLILCVVGLYLLMMVLSVVLVNKGGRF